MRGDRDVDSTLARKVLVLSFPTASGKAISYPCMSSCVRIDSLVVLVENWIVIQFVVFRSLPFVRLQKVLNFWKSSPLPHRRLSSCLPLHSTSHSCPSNSSTLPSDRLSSVAIQPSEQHLRFRPFDLRNPDARHAHHSYSSTRHAR